LLHLSFVYRECAKGKMEPGIVEEEYNNVTAGKEID
jgi:hypothetical protein